MASSDDGFAMVEVIVSAVLVIILAVATLQVLDASTKASSMNRSRDVASSLAQADQEHMRQLPLSSIAGGYHPVPQAKTVGGITYTIASSGDWTRDATGVITCSTAPSSAGRGDYLKITSTVTWPNMAASSSRPVVMESVVAPGVAALGASKGAIAIKLKKADGSGTAGIPVSSETVTGNTDSDGCVVLNSLDEGAHTVTWNSSGYVDPDGVTNISRAETISAGATAQDNGAYDVAARNTVTFGLDAAAVIARDAGTFAIGPAKWPTLSVTQTGMTTSNGIRSFPSKVATTKQSSIAATSLFPFTSAYGVFAGNCDGNDPLHYDADAGFAAPSFLVAPGADITKTVSMRSVIVDVTGSNLNQVSIYATPDTSKSDMTGCSGATDPITPNTTSGDAAIPIPYGIYKICVKNTSTGRFATANVVNTEKTTAPATPDSRIGAVTIAKPGSSGPSSC